MNTHIPFKKVTIEKLQGLGGILWKEKRVYFNYLTGKRLKKIAVFYYDISENIFVFNEHIPKEMKNKILTIIDIVPCLESPGFGPFTDRELRIGEYDDYLWK